MFALKVNLLLFIFMLFAQEFDNENLPKNYQVLKAPAKCKVPKFIQISF